MSRRASLLIEAGEDPLAIAGSLGHADTRMMFERYGRDERNFAGRLRAASNRSGLGYSDADIAEAWQDFLSGIFSVYLFCLKEFKEATPENIARKHALMLRIEELIVAPAESPAWRSELAAAVNELDALEMPFAPNDHIRSARPRRGNGLSTPCASGISLPPKRRDAPEILVQADHKRDVRPAKWTVARLRRRQRKTAAEKPFNATAFGNG